MAAGAAEREASGFTTFVDALSDINFSDFGFGKKRLIMLKGSTPVQLSQIDTSAFGRIAALNAAAQSKAVQSMNQSILDFAKKKREKKEKKEREEQVAAIFPTLLKTAGVDINSESPGYDELLKYVAENAGDDIMGFVKGVKDTMPSKTPTLQQIQGPGGKSIYSFDGKVVNPDNVIDPNAPPSTALGFEPEFPLQYMIPYDDGGTPDDPSDDTQATRVQVTTVSKDPGNLKYGDGTSVKGWRSSFHRPENRIIEKARSYYYVPYD